MYVVPSAYTIMLSRYGAHTKQVEQTNSVITYYCAVSVPSRSNRISRIVLAANRINRIVWTSAYGCGRERFVQYCFLWRSCADAGCHVYVPWVYHLAAKQGCTDVRVWLPKLGGLNIFCAHVLRGYLWASPPFFFFFFFFVDVGNRTNVFFVQEHILVKFGALRARSFNSRDKSLEGIDIVACMGVAVLACACVRAGSALPFVPFIARRAGT